MSQRVARAATFSVRIPLPAGVSLAKAKAAILSAVIDAPVLKGFGNQVIVKLVGRESTYL